jgi:hypothetical protein
MFTTLLRFLYGAVMTCPRPVRYTHLRVLSVRTHTTTGLAITLCRAQSPAPLTTRTAPHDAFKGTKNLCLGQSAALSTTPRTPRHPPRTLVALSGARGFFFAHHTHR